MNGEEGMLRDEWGGMRDEGFRDENMGLVRGNRRGGKNEG